MRIREDKEQKIIFYDNFIKNTILTKPVRQQRKWHTCLNYLFLTIVVFAIIIVLTGNIMFSHMTFNDLFKYLVILKANNIAYHWYFYNLPCFITMLFFIVFNAILTITYLTCSVLFYKKFNLDWSGWFYFILVSSLIGLNLLVIVPYFIYENYFYQFINANQFNNLQAFWEYAVLNNQTTYFFNFIINSTAIAVVSNTVYTNSITTSNVLLTFGIFLISCFTYYHYINLLKIKAIINNQNLVFTQINYEKLYKETNSVSSVFSWINIFTHIFWLSLIAIIEFSVINATSMLMFSNGFIWTSIAIYLLCLIIVYIYKNIYALNVYDFNNYLYNDNKELTKLINDSLNFHWNWFAINVLYNYDLMEKCKMFVKQYNLGNN